MFSIFILYLARSKYYRKGSFDPLTRFYMVHRTSTSNNKINSSPYFVLQKAQSFWKSFWLRFLFPSELQWREVDWGWWKRSRGRTWRGCSGTRSGECERAPGWCNSWRDGSGWDLEGVRENREIFLVISSLRRMAGRPRRWWRWWRGRGWWGCRLKGRRWSCPADCLPCLLLDRS